MSDDRHAYAEAGVSIEAADKAVELMKVWIDKARRPEMIGGIGGFAGLFDASALDVLRPAAAGHLHRRRRHQGRDRAGDGRARHDRLRPGRHGRRRPGRLRRRAAVHDRLHRHRPGRARADRGDRQGHRRGLRRGRLRAGRRRDRRAPGPARPRRVRRRRRDHRRRRGRPPARARPGPPRRRGARDGVLAGCTPTATRWCATCCWPADRGGPAGRSTATSPSSAAPSARSCSSRPGSTPRPAWRSPTGPASTRWPTSPAAAWPPTWPGCCPVELTATLERAHLDPAAGLRPGPPGRRRTPGRPRGDPQLRRRHGRAARPRGRVDAAIAVLAEHGIRAWVAGEVDRRAGDRGGTVELVGQHPGW